MEIGQAHIVHNISQESLDGLSSDFQGCLLGMISRGDKILVTLTYCLRSIIDVFPLKV